MLSCIVLGMAFLSACGDDEPEVENVEEVITNVTLTFTPADGGTAVTATATDPDGEGSQGLAVDGAITLAAGTSYTLSVELFNSIENEDITEELMEEDDEHQFFFAWTEGSFATPMGDGNIDTASDPVSYNDTDDNSLPVGLSTNWITGDAVSGSSFRVVLKHQPDIKTATSTANDGESDIDISWTLNVQ